MKRVINLVATVAFIVAISNTTAPNSHAAQQTPPAYQPANSNLSAPTVVASRTALSAEDLTKYRQIAGESRASADAQKAGAANDKTVWVIVGIVAVVVIVAAASGGSGGGGY
jgi:hypothetical protein